MTDKLRNEQMDMLIQAILSLKTPDDCYEKTDADRRYGYGLQSLLRSQP